MQKLKATIFFYIFTIFALCYSISATTDTTAFNLPNPIWSGYGFSQSGLTGINASWIVPSSSQTGQSVQWLGIGGRGSNLIQIGTAYGTSGDIPGYNAWYECFGEPNCTKPSSGKERQLPIPGAVYANDLINARITLNKTSGRWILYIRDITQNWSNPPKEVSFSPDNTTAEFIEERPTLTNYYLWGSTESNTTLPRFSYVSFGHDFTHSENLSVQYTVNGNSSSRSLAFYNNSYILTAYSIGRNITGTSGDAANPDPITPDGTSFWVTYGDLNVVKIKIPHSLIFGKNATFQAMVNGGTASNNLLYQWAEMGFDFSRTNLTSPRYSSTITLPITHNMILAVFVTDDSGSLNRLLNRTLNPLLNCNSRNLLSHLLNTAYSKLLNCAMDRVLNCTLSCSLNNTLNDTLNRLLNSAPYPEPEAYNYNEINFTTPNVTLSAYRAIPHSVPILLNNTQHFSITPPFQQLLTVNSTEYPINSNWTNVEFTNATGVPLQAWVESNATNSSTHTLVWVRLNQSIPASGNLMIYMDVMPNNMMSANGPTGEAPNLSSVYAEYDNGNHVFDSYDNFVGNLSGSGIGIIDSQVSSGSNNTGWRVDNGLTFGQLGDGISSVVYLSNLTINQTNYHDLNKTVDVPWEPNTQGICHDIYCHQTDSWPTGHGGFVGAGSFGFDLGAMRPDYCSSGSISSCSSSFYTFNGTAEVQHVFDSTINENYHYYTFLPPLSFSLYGGRFYLQNGYSGYNTSYGVGAPLNDTTSLHNSTDVFAMASDPHCWGCTTSYPAFLNNTATIHWIRVRNTPPNAVMPKVMFGIPLKVQAAMPALRSQILMVIANTTTNGLAKPPYTYTYSVVNEISDDVIHTVTVTTNAPSYTQNITLDANESENFPEVVNVVVTASNSSYTAASSYSPVVLFKTVPISLSAYGNLTSVDQGGTATWIVNSSEATSPYDLNASVYASDGMLVLTRNLAYQHGNKSSVTIPISVNLTPGTYILNITLNEWNNSDDNSYVGSGTNHTLFTVNQKMVAGLPTANATVVAKGSNATLYANVSEGTSPYLHYVWFYGTDRNCTTDVQEPWNWASNGGTKDINYDANASDSFSLRINSTTYFCYAVQDSAGAWAISSTTSVDLYHPNVTVILYNNQSVSTGAGFQQMVRIDPNIVIFQNMSSDGGNVRFFSGQTGLYSWRENPSLFWVRLPEGIPADSNLTINMTFLNKGIEYDDVYAGESPLLSETYGEYDNGANAFPFEYQNFQGTSTPGGWTITASAMTIDNGVHADSNGDTTYIHTSGTYGLNSSQIMDWIGQGTSAGQFTNGEFGYIGETYRNAAGWGSSGSGSGYTSIQADDSSSETQGTKYASLNADHVFTTYYPASGSTVYYYDYSNAESLTDPPTASLHLGGYVWSTPGNGFNAYVVRMRTRPPNGVMPSACFNGSGCEQQTTTTTSTTTSTISSTTSTSTSTSTSQTTTVSTGVTDYIGRGTGTDSYSWEALWPITASSSGTLQSVGVNVSTAAADLEVGIYSDSSGTPGAWLGNSTAHAMQTGWNDLNIPQSVAISEGNVYWLVLQGSDYGSFRTYRSPGGSTWLCFNTSVSFQTWQKPTWRGDCGENSGANMRMTYSESESTTTSTSTSTSSTLSTSTSTSTTSTSATSSIEATSTSTTITSTSSTTIISSAYPNVTMTLSNNQGTGTGTDFQQMIVIDATSALFQNATGDLGNLRFYFGNSEFHAWCESNCSSSSTHALFWINVSQGIDADGSLLLNVTFASGADYDGVWLGEAPQLSSTYGQYDNGPAIFPVLYQNFAGTGVPDGWYAHSGSVTVNDGLSIAFTSGTNNRFWTDADYGLNGSQVLDFYGNITGSGVSFTNTEFGYVETGGPAAGWGISGSTLEDMTGSAQGNINPSGSNHVFSTYWPSSSFSSFGYDYGTAETITSGLPSSQYPIGGITWSSNGGMINIHWVRIRTFPPNGVMPSVSFSG